MNGSGHEFFVLQGFRERFAEIFERDFGFGDGGERNVEVVVLEIFHEQEGVVHFFAGLDVEPVGETVVSFGDVVIGHVEIQVGGKHFFVNLLVQELRDIAG